MLALYFFIHRLKSLNGILIISTRDINHYFDSFHLNVHFKKSTPLSQYRLNKMIETRLIIRELTTGLMG